ncbi:MAG: hypothetical protein WBP81_35230 [Solirubrobacteraceae bacterium]
MLGFAFQSDPSFQKHVLDSTLRPGVALSLGLAGAACTGLGVTLAIGNALDHTWAVPGRDRRGFVKSRFRGLVVLASIGTMTVATTAVVGLAATDGTESAVARGLSQRNPILIRHSHERKIPCAREESSRSP